MRQKVTFQDIGQCRYEDAWNYQTELHKRLIDRKKPFFEAKNTSLPEGTPEHHLLFVEHPPVYTLGKSGTPDHLLLSEEELGQQGFEFFKINRGGDITYHGPGQLVVYPIFDLEYFFRDVQRYVRGLEETVIRTLADYGITAARMPGYTGVWLDVDSDTRKRKICAIGVHISRWVTLHGLAFNVNPELGHFHNIIPCGIQETDKGVTSLSIELGRWVDMGEVKEKVRGKFAEVFDFEYDNS